MSLRFTKMHALGNDFMVINGVQQKFTLSATEITQLADRHRGVGFDQCLVVEKSQRPEVDFFYRIFNADGSEVGQCGNGARCLALFLQDQGLTSQNKISVATQSSIMTLEINADKTVSVGLGIPEFLPQRIPFNRQQQAPLYPLQLMDGSIHQIYALQVGNPHAILFREKIQNCPVSTLGSQISLHPDFPLQCNVSFAEILAPDHISLRVFERGCGETQACGSAAVATVAAGILYKNLNKKVKVTMPGGDVVVYWPNTQYSIFLMGSAYFVYEGILYS